MGMLNYAINMTTGTNFATSKIILNAVDRQDKTDLTMGKFALGVAFGFLLNRIGNLHALTNKATVLSSNAFACVPLALMLSTFAVAQVAKKMGKYEDPLAKLDQYVDRFVEVAFSAASIDCAVLCARHQKWTFSWSTFPFALSIASIICKIYLVAQSYMPRPSNNNNHTSVNSPSPGSSVEKGLESFYTLRDFKKGDEPIHFLHMTEEGLEHDFRNLGNLQEEIECSFVDPQTNQEVTKKVSLKQALMEVIDRINVTIASRFQTTTFSEEIPLKVKRKVLLSLKDDELLMQYHLKKQWLLRIVDQLVKQSYVFKFHFYPEEQTYVIQA